MPDQKDLFPEIPEDLKGLSQEDLNALLESHEEVAQAIQGDASDLAQGMSADEFLAEYRRGKDQLLALRAEAKEREDAFENFKEEISNISSELVTAEADTEEEEGGDEDEGEEESDKAAAEVVAEAEAITEETAVEPILASVERRYARTAPAPAQERQPLPEPQAEGTALVAAGSFRTDFPEPLDHDSFADLQVAAIQEFGPMPHTEVPGKYRTEGPHGSVIWDGPRHKTAIADFAFPSDRELTGNSIDDVEKIREVMPSTLNFLGKPGQHGGEALVASGGLCAPLEPIYSMPNFGTEAEPVWESLPIFRARRGGVNVPTATYVADITSAISSISEEEDALGGTFATKSCQALECPDYTETAVQILAHCREYGNLNARAWPEKIAHENALTMQALARTSETFILERIKALSVNVTNGAETLGALIYLVDAIVKAKFGIAGRLRMPRDARFRVLLPSYAIDLLLLDTVQTQFDRYRSRDQIDAYLRSTGIDPVYYIDGEFAAGDSQLPDATQAAGAIDGLPNTIQWALFPEGAFIGVDMGVLELGIVRDSVLNSTNDFQVFGERFRNVALLAPQQAAYWVTTDWCPVGTFPPAGTARTCE